MADIRWHRVFHPLCGADPATLAGLVRRHGPPSLRRSPAFALAVATSLVRLPFTLAEAALAPLTAAGGPPPVFVVGHPRSGTTHLHNLLAASGAFETVPPVTAALPWEPRTLGPIMRPFVDPFLPRTRLIDGVRLRPDAPTEDEVGIANMTVHSYFHAIYFPRRFATEYRDGLLGRMPSRPRERAIRRYVAAMARRGDRPLLLKNPAYTAQVAELVRLFPGARIVHIHRDPRDVFVSTRRTLRRVLAEMALQDHAHVDAGAAVLETYPLVMDALRRGSAGLPREVFTEVAFEEVAEAPVEAVRRIWRELDLPGGAAALGCVADYALTVRGYRPAANRLGRIDAATLACRWRDDIARYGRLSARATG